MKELNWRRGKGSCNYTAPGTAVDISAKTCMNCMYTCHSQSFHCFLAKGHSLYFIFGVPIPLQCTLFPVSEVPQEVLFQPLYRFNEATVYTTTHFKQKKWYLHAVCYLWHFCRDPNLAFSSLFLLSTFVCSDSQRICRTYDRNLQSLETPHCAASWIHSWLNCSGPVFQFETIKILTYPLYTPLFVQPRQFINYWICTWAARLTFILEYNIRWRCSYVRWHPT